MTIVPLSLVISIVIKSLIKEMNHVTCTVGTLDNLTTIVTIQLSLLTEPENYSVHLVLFE